MNHRFLLDNDGNNLLCALNKDWRADVEEAVRECPPNVTTYLMCSNAGTTFFPTRVGAVRHTKPGEIAPGTTLAAAHARGEDPLGEFLKGMKATGRETFISMRMNDVHNPTEEWNLPPIRRRHPDCIVGAEEVRQGKAGWMAWCLDYARPEVREYALALIREQIELYGGIIDGLQLDWMRFPRHLSGTPEEVWSKRQALTDFIADARRVLAGAGRPVRLAVRVPTSLEGCRYAGMDVGEWSRRGLVDFVVASPFLTTDFAMPLRGMREAMGDGAVPLYAAFDFSHSGEAHCPESLRAAATGLYDSGADGIYIFNFPCWTERIGATPFDWLAGLETPGTAARKPLLFSVSARTHRVANVDLPPQLPAPLPAGGRIELSLPLPTAALPAWRCVVSALSGGDVALAVNGAAADERPLRRRKDLFVHFGPKPRADGKAPPPVTDDDSRLFYVAPAALRAGPNTLAIANRAGRDLMIQRVSFGLW